MKVLFDHPFPFLLLHGGFQVQIEQTKAAVEKLGVEVDFLHWWDTKQSCDLIHYFGRPWTSYIQAAQGRGIKVVVGDLLSGLGSRGKSARLLQKGVKVAVESFMNESILVRLSWDCFQLADACVALTPWEGQLMTDMFKAPPARVHCVPNGVEKVFLDSTPGKRGSWLVCTATITERKRPLELAQAAVKARTPVWIIGRPYGEKDAYAKKFEAFAKAHPDMVRYEGGVSDRVQLARIYGESRGFVLLSTMETLSLSALEAAACRCPLLLSDLPWARSTFEDNATYVPVGSVAQTAAALRKFYDRAPSLPIAPRPLSWIEVGEQFVKLYCSLLKK